MDNIPIIGLGTWNLKGSEGQKAIEKALEIGYRSIDTAGWYQNHKEVGAAIKNSKIKRSDLYITTKIPPPFSSQKILESGPRFLEELQIDYIDLLLVHWPDANPVTTVLRDFAKLKEKGITKEIGVSNFSLLQMEEAIKAEYEIYNHQYEIYPGNFDKEMYDYCRKHKITVTSYSPFAEGRIFQNPNAPKAQQILKWLMDKNIVVIPKASSEKHLRENWESTKIKLTKEITEKLDNF